MIWQIINGATVKIMALEWDWWLLRWRSSGKEAQAKKMKKKKKKERKEIK